MLTASLKLFISNSGLCLQAFLSWLGFEQTLDGDLDDSSDEAFNLQRALSLSSWPTSQALGPQSTFNSSMACMDYKPLLHESRQEVGCSVHSANMQTLLTNKTPFPLHTPPHPSCSSSGLCMVRLHCQRTSWEHASCVQNLTNIVAGQQVSQFLQPSCICLHL